jgi:hypothetical protein
VVKKTGTLAHVVLAGQKWQEYRGTTEKHLLSTLLISRGIRCFFHDLYRWWFKRAESVDSALPLSSAFLILQVVSFPG